MCVHVHVYVCTYVYVCFFFYTEQVLPQAFDGCKVVFQKGLSQNFQTMHTLTLGSTTTPSQWQFGATYVGSKKISEREVRQNDKLQNTH